MRGLWLLLLFPQVLLADYWRPPLFEYEEVFPARAAYALNSSALYASSLVKQAVYVSMTTISSRIDRVHKTILSIFQGLVIPDRLFLFISRKPFLLDGGIADERSIPEALRALVLEQRFPVTLVYTNNIGSHRKLLPLLAQKWHEDCLIATFDDEPKDDGKIQQYLSQLIKYYLASNRTSVVSLKARRMGMCRGSPWNIRNYGYWGGVGAGKNEIFLLPTGTGSVLYRPKFFHRIIFDPILRNLTFTADDLMFRLSTLANRVKVVTGCRDNFQRNKTTGLQVVARCPPQADITVFPSSRVDIKRYPSQADMNVFPTSKLDRRRLLGGSLAQLNLHKRGNDYAWRNATAYLLEKGVLNLTALSIELMPWDRGPACDSSTWDLLPLRHRKDPEGRELQRQRKECALSNCNLKK